ncbi:HTTM domain-containing protein [Corynebacterium pseudotuberculosis]|uniref:HTTM domain-containing protein n=1 Tax=Corynebacterium pseudotuberculosis TaxID=1719 RepID=UPI0009474895|nr:HTTM domain-containing protein [Corynebacterium pseudotuberculosis]APQ55317.1 Vitamin K-dependent gamma-carboxylase [Corynebacterium pseudotuberculosis]ASC74477.1 hypothetical protein BFG01_000690 [Corynebacterium pseudotuberculosis]AUY59531.1 Hypothetical protein BFG00_0143 [Corynebacterium pseudotuberculosis]QGX02714.1 hypothetical protein CP316_00690 [Corynebacterium pseudotuberculosis 316]WAE79034.1 HTTM domain-containing protein [Corynebacterium pseudotuberculosis]
MGILLNTGVRPSKLYSDITERRLYPRYGLALTRIGYASAVLLTLLTNIGDWRLLWGEDQPWSNVEIPNQVAISNDNFFVLSVIAVCSLSALTMLLGFYSRTSTFIVWTTYLTLMRSDPLISDGGDNVLQICLLFLAFTRCGDRISIDCSRKSNKSATAYSRALSNTGWLLIVIQTMILYATSGLAKVSGETWRSGEAIAFTLKSMEFSPWPNLNEWISSLHFPLILAAYATIFIQVYFPFLILNKKTKNITIIALIMFHLGIGLFMGVTSFAIVMIATEMCFLSDRFIRGIARSLRNGMRSITAKPKTSAEEPSVRSI